MGTDVFAAGNEESRAAAFRVASTTAVVVAGV
jgi:hypothetical protein